MTIKTLGQLIERLEDLRAELGADCEVRLMTQENWPFENAIHGVTSSLRFGEDAEEDPDDRDPEDQELPPIAYIVEGKQLKYGDKAAWDAAR